MKRTTFASRGMEPPTYKTGEQRQHTIQQQAGNDIKGIEKNKHWFKRQVEYLHRLPEEYQIIIQKWIRGFSFSSDSNKKHAVSKNEQRILNCIIQCAEPLEHGLHVFRGVENDYTTATFHSKRFASFSLKYSIAAVHANFPCCIYQLYLPKGTRCLFLSTQEYEIILPGDLTWHFEREYTDYNGRRCKIFRLVSQ